MSAERWSELPFESELPMLKVGMKNPFLPGPQSSLQTGHRSMAVFMKVAILHMSTLQSTAVAPGPPVSILISAFPVLCRHCKCKLRLVSNVWRTHVGHRVWGVSSCALPSSLPSWAQLMYILRRLMRTEGLQKRYPCLWPTVSFENDPSQNQSAVFTVMCMHLGVLVWQSRNRGTVILWARNNCGLA